MAIRDLRSRPDPGAGPAADDDEPGLRPLPWRASSTGRPRGADRPRLVSADGNSDGEGLLTTGHDPPGRTPRPDRDGPVLDRLERVFLARLDHLYNFLRGWLRDDHLAEDLTQQVFLKACLARYRFHGDDDAMVGWLFQIARNEATNLVRQRGRETSWEAMGVTAPEPVDPDQRPDIAAIRSEQRREVAALLDGLSPEQRELLYLRFAAGLTLVQIAGSLGISDVAARQRLRRTLAQLKGAIDDPTTLR